MQDHAFVNSLYYFVSSCLCLSGMGRLEAAGVTSVVTGGWDLYARLYSDLTCQTRAPALVSTPPRWPGHLQHLRRSWSVRKSQPAWVSSQHSINTTTFRFIVSIWLHLCFISLFEGWTLGWRQRWIVLICSQISSLWLPVNSWFSRMEHLGRRSIRDCCSTLSPSITIAPRDLHCCQDATRTSRLESYIFWVNVQHSGFLGH